MFSNNDNVHISALLPYKDVNLKLCHANQKRILTIIRFYAKLLQKSLNAVLQNNFNKFDPHVSDNLCQIRSCLFLVVSQDISLINLDPSIKINKYRGVYERCNSLLLEDVDCSTDRNSNKYKLTIKEFLEKKQLNIVLSQSEILLFSSYLLTKYRKFTNGIPCAIDYQLLNEDMGIGSSTMASKISHCLQRILSKISTKFIYYLSQHKLKSMNTYHLLRKLEQHDEIKRSILPCFWVTQVIMEYLQKIDSKIYFAIDLISFENKKITVECNLHNNVTKLVEHKNISQAMIFKGVSNWQHDIKTLLLKIEILGCKNIILNNMAEHPQYCGKKLEKYKVNPLSIINNYSTSDLEQIEKEFFIYKRSAQSQGCTIDNSELFLIQHIYFGQIKSQYELLEAPPKLTACLNPAYL